MERIKNFELGIDFLVRSIDSNTGGSAAYFSRIKNPINPWSLPYPETTGYIIPTFFEISDWNSKYNYLVQPAIKMADWIMSLQSMDGGLPGGVVVKKDDEKLSNFNTAQMILGLVDAGKHTKNSNYNNSALIAAKWLMNNQEDDGSWSKFHYVRDYFPSYYTRVAWPMLLVAKEFQDREIEVSAFKTLDLILDSKLENTLFKNSGFKANSFAFLHTICYVMEGFLESYLLCGNKVYWDAFFPLSSRLMKKFEVDKKLCGAYSENWEGHSWYRCLTGECQLALIWLKIYKITRDIRFLNAASKLLDMVGDVQIKNSSIFYEKGGLFGSAPIYGKYMSFRQPNWATKFYLDALLAEEKAYFEFVNR
jgi:hypothetical protein